MTSLLKLIGIIYVVASPSLLHAVVVSSSSHQDKDNVKVLDRIPSLLRREVQTGDSKRHLASVEPFELSTNRQFPAALIQNKSAGKTAEEPAWGAAITSRTTTTTVTLAPDEIVERVVSEHPISSILFGATVCTCMLCVCGVLARMVKRWGRSKDERWLQAHLDERHAEIEQLRRTIYEIRGLEIDPQLRKMLDDLQDFNPDCAKQLVHDLSQEAEKLTHGTHELKALIKCAERVKTLATEEAVQNAEKTKGFAKGMFDEIGKKVEQMMERGEEVLKEVDVTGFVEDQDVKESVLKQFIPPPLSLIIGAISARNSLASIELQSSGKVTTCAVLIILSIIVLQADEFSHSCAPTRHAMRVWLFGFICLLVMQLIVHRILASRAAFCLMIDDLEYTENIPKEDQVEEPEEEKRYRPHEEQIKSADDSTAGALVTFQERRGSLFNMLFKLQQIETSKLYKFASWLGVLRFLLDMVQIHLTIFDRVLPPAANAPASPELAGCKCTLLMWFFDIYCLVALAFLLFSFFEFIGHVFVVTRGMQCCAIRTLRTFRYVDTEYFYDVPVLTTLLRSFWLRDEVGILAAMASESTPRIDKLKEVILERQDQLSECRGHLELMKSLREDVKNVDIDWVQGYNEKIGRILAKMAPMVTFAYSMQGTQDHMKALEESIDHLHDLKEELHLDDALEAGKKEMRELQEDLGDAAEDALKQLDSYAGDADKALETAMSRIDSAADAAGTAMSSAAGSNIQRIRQTAAQQQVMGDGPPKKQNP